LRGPGVALPFALAICLVYSYSSNIKWFMRYITTAGTEKATAGTRSEKEAARAARR